MINSKIPAEKLSKVRTLIQKGMDRWFGRKICITERALQVLERAPLCDGGWMDSAEIFVEAIRFEPTLGETLVRAGVDRSILENALAEMRTRATLGRNDPSDAPDIETTLEFAIPKKCKVYATVKRSGRLRSIDIILGHVRAGISDSWGEVPTLTSHILAGLGANHEYWTAAGRRAVRDLEKRLDFAKYIDPDVARQQFVLFHDGRKYRIRPAGTFGAYQLNEKPLKDGSLWLARGNVLQGTHRFSEPALAELETLINSDAAEREFQKFFEAHPEFLLALGGGQYVDLHPQVIIHQDDGGRLIPDFFLEKINDKFCDVCDLKLATERIVRVRRNRPGFSAAVNEAISQLDYYRNWFEDKVHRDAFYTRTGLKAYRPKIVLIIGRRKDYYADVDRIQREGMLPAHAELITYDDVVDRVKNYKKIILPN